MLKIKDNVDLKELEKYGFKLNKKNKSYEQKIDGKWWDIRAIDIEDRCLVHYVKYAINGLILKMVQY